MASKDEEDKLHGGPEEEPAPPETGKKKGREHKHREHKEHKHEHKHKPKATDSLLGRKAHDDTYVWQDREIRFDIPGAELDPRQGEYIIETLEPVEDTKGNSGEKGELVITNLRLIWYSKKNKKTNICIGYSCITAINVRNTVSRIKGAVVQDSELKLLPQEQTYSKVNGVWNLSSEQGNLGTFFITNVRLVWHANLNENFNVSIPYLQMKAIKVRESKFGPALVIETTPRSGGYILGFKIDPKETLNYVFKELSSLWQVYSVKPIFGVEFQMDDKAMSEQPKISSVEEDVEIVDPGDKGDFLAAYYADASKSVDRDPIFSSELGLAVEALRDGMTIEQLWNVI